MSSAFPLTLEEISQDLASIEEAGVDTALLSQLVKDVVSSAPSLPSGTVPLTSDAFSERTLTWSC